MAGLSLLAVLVAPGAAVAREAGAGDGPAWTERCYAGSGNRWTIDLPAATDLELRGAPCVHSAGDRLYASVRFSWDAVGSPALRGGHAFDGVEVRVRLERRRDGSTTDSPLLAADCDLTDEVNGGRSGAFTCRTGVHSGYDAAFDYSGDGWVDYDLGDDGKGYLGVRNLTGSPPRH